jgi:disintegrin and metalloproteinase domain-containing protein 10
LGDKESFVHGSISDGVFHGRIITSKDSYFVEKARYYFPNHSHVEDGFHSVIYKDKHVDDPYKNQRTVHANGCGLTEDVSHWMDRIQNSVEDEEEIEVVPLGNDTQKEKTHYVNNLNTIYENDHPHVKYSKEANSRTKRGAARNYQERNTCSLYIQTDPLIWRHIRESIPDHSDPSRVAIVDEKAKEEILSLVAHHVAAVNFIYRNTKFDGRVEHRNIRFEVQRIKIDDDAACSMYYRGDPNPFCMENIDVSNFLNLHSLGNHEHFCLAYVFTYR